MHVIINNIAWSSLHSYTVILLSNSSSILAYYSIYISKLTLCHVYLKVHLMPTVRPSIYQLVFLSAADWYIFCYRKFSCVAVPRGSSIIDFSLPLNLMFRSSKVLFQYKYHLSSYRNLHAVECMKGNKTSLYDHCQLTVVIWMLSFHLWKELLLYLSVSFLYSTYQYQKSHNALFPYPTIHHSEQKCAHFCSACCLVGFVNLVHYLLTSTQWLTHWLYCLLTHLCVQKCTCSLTHFFTHLLICWFTHLLICTLIDSLTWGFSLILLNYNFIYGCSWNLTAKLWYVRLESCRNFVTCQLAMISFMGSKVWYGTLKPTSITPAIDTV